MKRRPIPDEVVSAMRRERTFMLVGNYTYERDGFLFDSLYVSKRRVGRKTGLRYSIQLSNGSYFRTDYDGPYEASTAVTRTFAQIKRDRQLTADELTRCPDAALRA